MGHWWMAHLGEQLGIDPPDLGTSRALSLRRPLAQRSVCRGDRIAASRSSTSSDSYPNIGF
ncbi:hypothetical protein [Burkholderia sp. BCC1977]|uniref:hypothetical protein n=1 Tax=Burkholderia sp. BCC1977 TaxID=2817440 RepID=UPI002ABE97B0|nr:hypothetical protein [Burkholderia sp. BCC1977]